MLRRGVEMTFGPIREATERSLGAAKHLGELDAGAVETLRAVADHLDMSVSTDGHPDHNAVVDYTRLADALGLTPAGRAGLVASDDEVTDGGRLAQLRAIVGGA